ncbi:hypothetical protein MBM_04924 [Drepanopeziza brunnea f. sp. 'multigermtubi' MB_m1]|uniref:Uncharacterized protein n=1 Tax=Marssonina brunnea f. sp. multigermtubi (strain MB_m1) TaxID=1072389 RepID=K1WG15_MARBU|nr:uncharacterized protein MBM_04924 [Drepanopeziza brunnea f. sp. 'multigermtubi' MB_m1]EKD16455.1 hypothetical protein MBM_04924 [Drepanopeziza brunnea f. sp. 'multigermtubi' MB_m1]
MSTSSSEYASNNVMVNVNPFSSDGNHVMGESFGRYNDFVVVYFNGAIVTSMFTCFDNEDTALFPRPTGIQYEYKGRKGFVDEFGIKHYGANKNETAQVLCLLDHLITFINQIGKQHTHKDVKIRLIIRDPTLEVFDSAHPEAKKILEKLLRPYPFTTDGTSVYGRLKLPVLPEEVNVIILKPKCSDQDPRIAEKLNKQCRLRPKVRDEHRSSVEPNRVRIAKTSYPMGQNRSASPSAVFLLKQGIRLILHFVLEDHVIKQALEMGHRESIRDFLRTIKPVTWISVGYVRLATEPKYISSAHSLNRKMTGTEMAEEVRLYYAVTRKPITADDSLHLLHEVLSSMAANPITAAKRAAAAAARKPFARLDYSKQTSQVDASAISSCGRRVSHRGGLGSESSGPHQGSVHQSRNKQYPTGTLSRTQQRTIESFLQGITQSSTVNVDPSCRGIHWIVSATLLQPHVSNAIAHLRQITERAIRVHSSEHFPPGDKGSPTISTPKVNVQLHGRFSMPLVDSLVDAGLLIESNASWANMVLSETQPIFVVADSKGIRECKLTHNSCAILEESCPPHVGISSPQAKAQSYSFRSRGIMTGNGTGPSITIHRSGTLQYQGKPENAYTVGKCFKECIESICRGFYNGWVYHLRSPLPQPNFQHRLSTGPAPKLEPSKPSASDPTTYLPHLA